MPAVGSTYLQVVNFALRRLRRATMTDFSAPTDYQQFIMDLVNTVKTEVEQAWTWQALRDTYQVTTQDGVGTYAFTGAGAHAQVLSARNATYGGRILRGRNADFDDAYLAGQTVPTGGVYLYIENGVDASYDMKVDVLNRPGTTTQLLNFNLYAPQADLSATTDVPKAPAWVIIEGVVAYAMQERADEAADKQMARFQTTLANAVANDVAGMPEDIDWEAE